MGRRAAPSRVWKALRVPVLRPTLGEPPEGTARLQGSGSRLGLELGSGSVGTGGVASRKREGASSPPGFPPPALGLVP